MSVSEIALKLERMKKISSIKEKYDSKVKQRKDGRFYVYINRKQIIAPTEEELYDKLFDLFYGKETWTLEDLFPKYLKWLNDNTPTKGRTLQIDTQIWEKRYKNQDIIKIPLRDLTAKDFDHLYLKWTKNREMTSKAFSNAKSIVNGIYTYAITELDISVVNVSKTLNSRRYPMKQVNNSDKVFLLEDREKILQFLKNDKSIYSLAICFAFCIPLRIGELLALKWEDIEGDKIKIHKQRTMSCKMKDDLTFTPRKYETVNQTKGFSEKGIRKVTLPGSAIYWLKRVKELYPNSTYIFENKKGGPLTTNSFNRKLKGICKKLGIKEYSSHKIRFCTASMFYQMNIPLPVIQLYLGHTTLSMTIHYLRNVITDSKTDELIAKL